MWYNDLKRVKYIITGEKMARKNGGKEQIARENEKRENYKDKIYRHKMSAVYRFLLVLAVVFVLGVIVYLQYRNHVYTSYDTVSMSAIEIAEKAKAKQLGENVLIYSSDGAHCVNAKGEILWDQSFEMQNMIVATNGDAVAFGDHNGHEIYVLNSTQKICEIKTPMPIRGLAVAGNGRVAVDLADTKITWIYIYETDGTQLYEVRATMGQSGYPTAMAMSPNGELMGVAFTYVDSALVETRIAFYNFGAVGANMTDYKVNAYTYKDAVVPHFRFLDGETAVAVADDRLIIYKGSQKPAEQAQHFIADEIQAVYQNNGYVGIVLRSDVLDMRYKVEVFNQKAEKEGTYYLNMDFDEIVFAEDYFIAYNRKGCHIQTYKGLTKFDGDFLGAVELMYPVGKGNGYKYVLVSKSSIDTIQLK